MCHRRLFPSHVSNCFVSLVCFDVQMWRFEIQDLPVRPGISTPLAPVTLVTTPWAETEAARQATATEEEERILIDWRVVVVTVSNRSKFVV